MPKAKDIVVQRGTHMHGSQTFLRQHVNAPFISHNCQDRLIKNPHSNLTLPPTLLRQKALWTYPGVLNWVDRGTSPSIVLGKSVCLYKKRQNTPNQREKQTAWRSSWKHMSWPWKPREEVFESGVQVKKKCSRCCEQKKWFSVIWLFLCSQTQHFVQFC